MLLCASQKCQEIRSLNALKIIILCKCFVYMHVCIACAYLMLMEVRRGCWIPPEKELWMFVSHHVGVEEKKKKKLRFSARANVLNC